MSHPNQPQPEDQVPDPGWPARQAPAGWPQTPQPAQPPSYGNPPPLYGTGAPVYGIPRRATGVPGMVIAAAIVALLTTGWYAVFIWILVKAGSDDYVVRSDREASLVAALVDLVSAGLMIWGAVAALRGRTRKILLFASLAIVIVDIVEIAATVALSFPPRGHDFTLEGVIPGSAGLLMVGSIVVIILISIQSSVEFFRARRGSKI